MSHFPAVGIGILNWNGRQYLEQFLPSLCSITYPNYTIYVIDNDSTDDSLAFLEEQYPQVKIIHTGGNLGFAGGYNVGFSQILEPYLVMINSDVEVTPTFLDSIIAKMESDHSIAVCQPKILSWHNKKTFEHAGAAGGMLDLMGYSFCRGRIFDTVEEDMDQYGDADIFWASGACCVIRKTAFDAIGGMYPYFFMHFEEIDLCWRMLALNYRVVYCKSSRVYHVGGGSLSYQSPTKTYYNFRNNLILCVRNSSWIFIVWWLPMRFCLDQVAALRFLMQKDTANALAVIKAYWGLIVWLFTVRNKMPQKSKSLLNIPVVLKRPILWLYFVKKKKKYSQVL
jgi:GT2 family glycosyltransferase